MNHIYRDIWNVASGPWPAEDRASDGRIERGSSGSARAITTSGSDRIGTGTSGGSKIIVSGIPSSLLVAAGTPRPHTVSIA
jgi:hypothetical protein